MGRAASPNKHTGHDIFIEWRAKLVPLRECEGGGWYTTSTTRKGWAFSYKAAHKRCWSIGFEDSTWNEEPLADLLKEAVLKIRAQFCAPDQS